MEHQFPYTSNVVGHQPQEASASLWAVVMVRVLGKLTYFDSFDKLIFLAFSRPKCLDRVTASTASVDRGRHLVAPPTP